MGVPRSYRSTVGFVLLLLSFGGWHLANGFRLWLGSKLLDLSDRVRSALLTWRVVRSWSSLFQLGLPRQWTCSTSLVRRELAEPAMLASHGSDVRSAISKQFRGCLDPWVTRD
jgi:hypothetical protein